MIGSQFMLKTMLAVFSVPLLANADIHVNIDPIKSAVASYQAPSQVEVAQLQQAAQMVSSIADMQGQEYDPAFEKTMANVNALIAQQKMR